MRRMSGAIGIFAGLMLAGVCMAAPVRVALLDCEDTTGARPDALLGGAIAPGAVAQKGAYLLGKQLAGSDAFVVIDRRDFFAQVEREAKQMEGGKPGARPSFIHAAQALNADVVLRSSLLSFDTGKQMVNQGSFRTELSTLSLRVALEALDAVDGTVVAVADGVARKEFRQSEKMQTVISEDDVLQIMEDAISQAIPGLKQKLENRQAQLSNRPSVKLSVTTTADPALVEIDGILVGSTPLENHVLYKGDHVLTVGKAGCRDVTKRIIFEKDTTIEVPLLRTELSADELKSVLEKMRIQMYSGVEPALIIRTIDRP